MRKPGDYYVTITPVWPRAGKLVSVAHWTGRDWRRCVSGEPYTLPILEVLRPAVIS